MNTVEDKSTPLERYVRVLEAIAASGGSATAGELVSILGLPRPTTHRLLKGLVDTQLIIKLSENRYGIADRLKRLSLLSADDRWFEPVLRPIVMEIAQTFNMTTYVGKFNGQRVVSVMVESPEEPWRGFVLPGREFAPHAAAGAKAILAFHPDNITRGLLEQVSLPSFTAKTICSVDGVLEEYEKVRRQRYASCVGEIDDGMNALAVPVLASSQIVMSVGVTGPISILPETSHQTFAEQLHPFAVRIAALLDARR